MANGWGVLPLLTGYALATLLPFGLAVYVATREGRSGAADVFGLTMLAIATWSGAYLMRLVAPSLDTKFAWTVVATAPLVLVPVGFLLFALLYTGRVGRVGPRLLAALSVHPVLTLAALVTTRETGLFFDTVGLDPVGGTAVFEASPGPLFWVHGAYAYALLLVSTVLLVAFAVRHRRLYRLHVLGIVVGALVPWVANVVHLAGLSPFGAADPTPIGFAFGSVLLAISVLDDRLVRVSPVARDAVFGALDDAVVVLDDRDHVVDANPTATHLLGPASDVLGRPAAEVLPGAVTAAESPATVRLSVDGEERRFRQRRLPVGPDGRTGTVLLLTDVTELARQREHLERQNERMAEFSAAAAHHLRNPLGVVTGYVDLARTADDERYLDGIEDATARMTRLVNDLLTVSREGRLVDDTVPVDLARIAADAWERVDTGDARIHVEEDLGVVTADPERLARLFEHLFENCVEHGSTSNRAKPDDCVEHGSTGSREGSDDGVFVRVGRIQYGFYVEDDGPGFPAGREDVFGYDQAPGPEAGFGLTLVRSIVDAHGWRVRATDREGGGARVEVTGVSRRAPGTATGASGWPGRTAAASRVESDGGGDR